MSDRADKVKEVIKKLNEDFGKGTVVTNEIIPGIKKFSSGCVSVDIALGGGWGRGRIVEVFGPESSGKSTLALEAVASIQRAGGLALFVDAEHALDPEYSRNLGVNTDELIFSQPGCGETAIEVVDSFATSGLVDLIVVDSVAALVPKAEIEGQMEDSAMGAHARLMSKAMRVLTGPASKSGTTIMFINQLRNKIVLFGDPRTTTGGNALKFYASQRVELKNKGLLKDKHGNIIGRETLVKVVKNRIAPPFKETSVVIRHGTGTDSELDILRLAVEREVVAKAGSWYSLGEKRLGQGEDKVCDLLRIDAKLRKDIVDRLKGLLDAKLQV